MKRKAPTEIEANDFKKQRTVSEEPEPVYQIQGDDFFMDIWQAIFNQCDGAAIVPLTMTCKRFYNRINVEDPQLRAEFESPVGILERIVTSYQFIKASSKATAKSLVQIVFPVTLINGIDTGRIAKLLVRMKSSELSNYLLTNTMAELTTIEKKASHLIQDQLSDQILVEYSAFSKLLPGTFPANMPDFEKYITDNEVDVWAKFKLAPFLLPLTYFSDSDILSEKILDSALLKIWKEVTQDLDTFTREANKTIRLALDHGNRLINKFQKIAPYFSMEAMQSQGKKFILMATLVHNCSNNHYHELFRMFLSTALDRDTLANDANFKGCLDKDRRAVCEASHDLKSLFRMAAEYGLPLEYMMDSIEKWLLLSSCTQVLRRTITDFQAFNDTVQTSEEFSWLPTVDVNLAAELINSFATFEKITGLISSLFTLDCPTTRLVILQLVSKRTTETVTALNVFLFPLGCGFFEETSLLRPLFKKPLSTFAGSMPSLLALESLYQIFETIKKPKSFIKALAHDVELVWLHRNDATFDSSQFHQLVAGLPTKILNRLIGFFRKSWFLQSALHLSGQLVEFYQLFPYLSTDLTEEEEFVSKALVHRLGPHRMEVSVRRFHLDQTTFDSNRSNLAQH